MERTAHNDTNLSPLWRLKAAPAAAEVARLRQALGGRVSPLIAQLLLQRDIHSFAQAKAFFNPALTDLHDPFLMRDMQSAVDRITAALERGENILVYGDYDVDGTTAVALVYHFLSERCDLVSYYIPDRYKEGYGLSRTGIDFASDNDFSLLIVLDCGIKAVDQIQYAHEQGIDVIVCDHHTPGQTLPCATALLNPKCEGDPYPFKELSGCGIGFKLVQALSKQLGCNPEAAYTYLDLVAISIAADLVPMRGENRILTHSGLQRINRQARTGVRALMACAGRTVCAVRDLVFGLAPRINAAGRVDHGSLAVALLTERDPERAAALAKRIETHNQHRKTLEQQTQSEALAQLLEEGATDRASNVVFSPHWHKGVIGIVASKLIETAYKPTVVFTQSEGALVASARSVAGFDLYRALEACAGEIHRFGGHKYAAGLTVMPCDYERFKARFEAVVRTHITEDQKRPSLQAEAELPLSALSLKRYHTLARLAPFGPGNRQPLFFSRGLRAGPHTRPVGQNGAHLKIQAFQSG